MAFGVWRLQIPKEKCQPSYGTLLKRVGAVPSPLRSRSLGQEALSRARPRSEALLLREAAPYEPKEVRSRRRKSPQGLRRGVTKKGVKVILVFIN